MDGGVPRMGTPLIFSTDLKFPFFVCSCLWSQFSNDRLRLPAPRYWGCDLLQLIVLLFAAPAMVARSFPQSPRVFSYCLFEFAATMRWWTRFIVLDRLSFSVSLSRLVSVAVGCLHLSTHRQYAVHIYRTL